MSSHDDNFVLFGNLISCLVKRDMQSSSHKWENDISVAVKGHLELLLLGQMVKGI